MGVMIIGVSTTLATLHWWVVRGVACVFPLLRSLSSLRARHLLRPLLHHWLPLTPCTRTPHCRPVWGGMFTPRQEGATEEDYYLAEWDAEEVASNLHIPRCMSVACVCV